MVSNVGFAWQTLTPKVFNSGFNALCTKNEEIPYHAMHICLVMLILKLLVNFYTTAFKLCFSPSRKWKGYQEATERVMYSINCMPNYSTPNLSVQWWWCLFNWQLEVPFNCFLDLECMFVKRCISILWNFFSAFLWFLKAICKPFSEMVKNILGVTKIFLFLFWQHVQVSLFHPSCLFTTKFCSTATILSHTELKINPGSRFWSWKQW